DETGSHDGPGNQQNHASGMGFALLSRGESNFHSQKETSPVPSYLLWAESASFEAIVQKILNFRLLIRGWRTGRPGLS
ncbi:MAG: hypothetical protein ACRD4Q_09685, partial [Candidatus Acidiferrales bacterium]